MKQMLKYRRYLFLFLLIFTFPLGLQAKPYTVVIDAGHGGKDAGAVGYVLKVQEKDLNLDVSLRLASRLRTAYPDINVVLTRSDDVFLPLQKRADIVNKNNADLFICIHTNSAESRSARGAETFVLGTERMQANLDVAMRENAVMKLEQDYQTTYEGFDPNSIYSYIMFELMQNQYMDKSLQFATYLQNRFVSELKLDDRGVRQAAFWVLLKSACPSVLVEMGFISNKEEEKYLASDKGKREITDAIFNAFVQYYTAISGKADEQKEEPEQSAEKVDNESKQEVKPETKVKEKSKKKSEPKSDKSDKTVKNAPATVYRVQIFSSRTVLPEGDKEFKGLKGCVYEKRDVWYKYMYGAYSTRKEAEDKCKELQTLFPGCFVVQTNSQR